MLVLSQYELTIMINAYLKYLHPYHMYPCSIEAHPEAGKARGEMNDLDNGRPLDSFEANCNWYYEFEKRFPNANYKMEYWLDILAVSPDAKLSDPVTYIGKILAKNL